jgi:hypothetical protein
MENIKTNYFIPFYGTNGIIKDGKTPLLGIPEGGK